ncbi:hypothetical protein ACFWOL_22120 [Streptomyces sp. NPDC058442]|uniref:hypothetical protein n=1 Tax=Streptomyces sp. NPDC058442 TaxID=3346503 RepID=UPI00365CF72B
MSGSTSPYEGSAEKSLEALHRLDECRMRWTGVYVLLHTGDQPEPTHLGIFGYSGD